MGLFQRLSGLLEGKPPPPPHVLETDSFRVELPDGWLVNLQTKPVSAGGPAGQTLEFSSFKISGSGSTEELLRLRAEVAESLKRTMLRAASSELFEKGTEISERVLSPEVTLIEGHARSVDGAMVFAQIGLLSRRTALYVNGRFRPDGEELSRVRAQLESATWF